MRRTGVALVAIFALTGCPNGPQSDDPRMPDIIGTWEVIQEPVQAMPDDNGLRPYTIEQHRYLFAEDSTLHIYRPRPLGPASRIRAAYDFRGDTLIIQSEFDSGYYLPEISNDTLYLMPLDSGRPMALVRVANGIVPEEAPMAVPPGNGDEYVPPSDLPPEDMPRN